MKKRPCPSELVSPLKKGPGVLDESAEPPDIASSNMPLFSPGLSEKTPTISLFEAARKGKTKLGSVVLEPKVTYGEQSLPSSNENCFLELQGAVQAYCSSNTEEIDTRSIS
jgi:hypothetical protein